MEKKRCSMNFFRPFSRPFYVAVALLAAFFIALCPGGLKAYAAGGLSLSTDYPGISINAGESLNISLRLSNQSGTGLDADTYIASLPEGFEGYIQGGSYHVSRVHVDNGGETEVTLHITVPDELSEGIYEVVVRADAGAASSDELRLSLNASETNEGEGSFTSEYPHQEGAAGTDFSFSTTLINNGLTARSYSLSSNAPSGWTVSFTPSSDSTQIAGIDVDPGASEGISVAVAPPDTVEAGEYTIELSAVSAEETLSTELTVEITGTYGLLLSTPSGRLSFDGYAGKASDLTLSLTNTGNVDLQDVTINSSVPSDWTVTYETGEDAENDGNVIASIPAGSTVEVVTHVTPGSDSITGDYLATFTASNDETSAEAEFRVSVKTQTLWGVVAVALIAAVAAGLYYVFRRYGRR